MKTPNEEKTYIGLTATSFKARYMNHKASFNNRAKSNQTELSKHIWKLKDDGSPYSPAKLPQDKTVQSVPVGKVLYNNSGQKYHTEYKNRTHLHMQAQEEFLLV